MLRRILGIFRRTYSIRGVCGAPVKAATAFFGFLIFGHHMFEHFPAWAPPEPWRNDDGTPGRAMLSFERVRLLLGAVILPVLVCVFSWGAWHNWLIPQEVHCTGMVNGQAVLNLNITAPTSILLGQEATIVLNHTPLHPGSTPPAVVGSVEYRVALGDRLALPLQQRFWTEVEDSQHADVSFLGIRLRERDDKLWPDWDGNRLVPQTVRADILGYYASGKPIDRKQIEWDCPESKQWNVVRSAKSSDRITLKFCAWPVPHLLAEGLRIVLGPLTVAVAVGVSLLILAALILGGTPMIDKVLDILTREAD